MAVNPRKIEGYLLAMKHTTPTYIAKLLDSLTETELAAVLKAAKARDLNELVEKVLA